MADLETLAWIVHLLLFGGLLLAGTLFVIVCVRASKRRQFGIRTMLEVVVVFAIAFSLMRSQGVLELWDSRFPLAVPSLGIIALLMSVGVVVFFHAVGSEACEMLCRRGKRKESDDPLKPPKGD